MSKKREYNKIVERILKADGGLRTDVKSLLSWISVFEKHYGDSKSATELKSILFNRMIENDVTEIANSKSTHFQLFIKFIKKTWDSIFNKT